MANQQAAAGEVAVGQVERAQLGAADAGVEEEEHHGGIAPTDGGGGIARRQQARELGGGEGLYDLGREADVAQAAEGRVLEEAGGHAPVEEAAHLAEVAMAGGGAAGLKGLAVADHGRGLDGRGLIGHALGGDAALEAGQGLAVAALGCMARGPRSGSGRDRGRSAPRGWWGRAWGHGRSWAGGRQVAGETCPSAGRGAKTTMPRPRRWPRRSRAESLPALGGLHCQGWGMAGGAPCRADSRPRPARPLARTLDPSWAFASTSSSLVPLASGGSTSPGRRTPVRLINWGRERIVLFQPRACVADPPPSRNSVRAGPGCQQSTEILRLFWWLLPSSFVSPKF